MNVRQRLLVTFALCLSITLGATFVLHLGQQTEAAGLARSFAQERKEQLAGTVRANSESLGLFVDDYSGWDEMVTFSETLDPTWARLNIIEVMARFRLEAVWLVDLNGRVRFTASCPGAEDAPPPPPGLKAWIASCSWSEGAGGFYRAGDQLIEVRMRPVQPTADTKRQTMPVAWLLAARPLDPELLEDFARQLQATVSLHGADVGNETVPEGHIVVHHALPSYLDGRPIGELHAAFRIAALELGEHYNRGEMLVGLCSGALLLGVVAWSINRNVLRPLSRIGESLERDSLAPLAEVPAGLPEFARIANLVRQSFEQRETLRHEINERARLGRDLHDGVIQNLYATGLGLAQAQRIAASDPAGAVLRLEQTRQTLNQTMEALRGFIARAEPEASGRVDFADACVTLFQTLRVEGVCELDLNVETEIAARLPAGTQANLLLIVREAISNALRHGAARHVEVSLRFGEARNAAGGLVCLRVRDDGCGFVSAVQKSGGGRGLDNIRARAKELGGTAELESKPGCGLELSVRWPLSEIV